jgi:predicted nucleotidyltransferase
MIASPTPSGWYCSDVTFTDNQQTAASECVEILRSEGRPVLGAFLAGSLAVGLGHALSDVDLYMVVDGKWDRKATRVHADELSARFQVQLQVITIQLQEAERLIEQVSAFKVTAASRSQIELSDAEMMKLTRMVTGRWILHPQEHFAGFPGANARQGLRRIVMTRSAQAVSAYCEDSYGTITARDYRTAVRCAVLAVEHACEAVLAAADDLYHATKFLHRRLNRCPATAPIADEVWGLLAGLPPAGADADQVQRFVESRLHAATGLVGHAVLDGWEKPLQTCPLPTRSSGGPARHPAYAISRFDDGIGITGLDHPFRVTEPMARLWLSLDGAALAAPDGLAETAQCAAELAAINRLVHMGVATTPSVPAQLDLHTEGR